MKSFRIIFLFLLCCFCFSCRKDIFKITSHISVSGTVTDKETHQPIAGVPVVIDALQPLGGLGGFRKPAGQGITDANGHYSIDAGIFANAQSLAIMVNEGAGNTGYSFTSASANISDLDRSKTNNKDFSLIALAALDINYKNVTRTSDSDLFRFSVFSTAQGMTLPTQTSCGTVPQNTGDFSWTGKDVCGTYSVMLAADEEAHISWDVYSNGVHHPFKDSVFVKRGAVTNYP